MKRSSKKIIFVIASALLAAAMAVSAFAYGSSIQPVRPEIDFDRQAYAYNEDLTIYYRFKTPTYYDGTRKYPLILYLHGSGENISDNNAQPSAIQNFFYNTRNENPYETFFVVPDAPEGKIWNGDVAEATISMVEDIAERYPVDRDRIYVIGCSNGGYGTWNFLALRGELFAAGVPICGWYSLSAAEKYKDIPIYVFHGGNDPIIPPSCSRDLVRAIKRVGGTKILYTEYRGAGHNVWDQAVWFLMWDNWVFEQRLSDREPNKPRVTLTDVCAKPGETFSTTLRFENCDFDGPYETFVNFNKNIMRFSSVSGEGVTASLIKDGQLLVSCNNPEKETVLHFKLKPGMEEGTYSLATIPKTKYGDGLFMLNSDCKLMIYNDILGDLNGNGIVDETDAILLGRWLAGWNVEITENAANVNRDGGVTEEDAVMMSRYFAGHRISFGERK